MELINEHLDAAVEARPNRQHRRATDGKGIEKLLHFDAFWMTVQLVLQNGQLP